MDLLGKVGKRDIGKPSNYHLEMLILGRGGGPGGERVNRRTNTQIQTTIHTHSHTYGQFTVNSEQ